MIPFNDCRRGTGKIQRGYYRKTRNNVTYPQHRLAYMDKFGPISSDLIVHHNCQNKWCVNPDHLTPMTRSEHQKVHANIAAKEYYKTITTCPKGHPLDGRGGRQRFCTTCKKEIAKIYRSKPEIKQKQHEYYLKRKEVQNVTV